ncbi:MAG: cation:proton antiporter [Acidobacteriota bacterium]
MGIAADFVLIILAGLIGGILARLLRMPLLVGYVAAGVFVGPYTAGPRVTEIHEIELLAEIGVALLLFSLGLEISIRDLQPVRNIAAIGGSLQMIVTTGLGAAGAVYGLGLSWTEGIWFGAMISVSSTMVVLKTLAEAGLTSTLASRVMIGLLVMQDLAVIPLLVILPQLGSLDGLAWKLARALAIASALLFGIAFVGTRLLPKFLRKVLQWGSRELFLVAVVAISVGVGYATFAAGLSFALGAFVAGMMLSESEFSHQALSDVVPLRDIFGLLFFVSVGMLFDPKFALENAGRIVVVVLLIFVGKGVILGGITSAFSYGNMAPWIVGFGLAQIGEFSFVLARTGITGGFLSKPTYDLVLTCTILTMALSPVVAALALPVGGGWRRWWKSAPVQHAIQLPPAQCSAHVIVAGFGRTGRAAARALQVAGIPVLIVESHYASLTAIRDAGFEGIWGDIATDAILHAAHAGEARVLMLTMPDRNIVNLAVERARLINPGLILIARALRERHVAELRAMGVEAVIQPEFEGGVEMVRQALVRYDRDDASVAAITGQLRQELYGARRD